MASKKKQRSEDYHNQIKEAERKFEELGLARPQDTFKDLAKRARQLNFGLLNYSKHPTVDLIARTTVTKAMTVPRLDWNICDNKNFKWVQNEEEFSHLMRSIKACSEIAIDVEFHSHRSLKGFVGLIQIGTCDYGGFLLDPFTIRPQICNELKLVLESNEILKIGHDIRNDTIWLQANFDIFMVNAIDTQLMYEIQTGEKMIGLKSLVLTFWPNLFLPKATLSDWRLRPGKGMTSEQEEYAVNDVFLLLRVFDQMRSQMSIQNFTDAFEETKVRLRKISPDLLENPSEKNYDEYLHKVLVFLKSHRGNPRIKKLINKVTNQKKAIFRGLLEWRDMISKIIDDKPDLLVRPEKLLYLAVCEVPTLEAIKSAIGKVHPVIFLSDDEPRQFKILQKLIESNGSFIMEIRNYECMNCLKIGHGPPWACPFPKINANYKVWMNRPENEKYRHKQFNRRYENLVKKFGEERAKTIIEKTKQNKY